MIERTEQEIMVNWKSDSNVPLVSVCTITYNHEKYIAQALDSFLMQETMFPFEIIIDDDCSKDKTSKIIKEYEKKYPNIIKANCRSQNIGMMPNFIANLKRAKGEYIALCEGDDFWIDDNKIEYQIEKMLENNYCNFSFHPSKELENGVIGNTIAKHFNVEKILSLDKIILGGGEFCPTASIIMNSCIIKNLPNWFDSAPVGDHYLQILGAIKGGALFLPKPMSLYRVGHAESWDSMMKYRDKVSMQELMKNRKKHTESHILTLVNLKTDLKIKYQRIIDKKISERLLTLAILYLKNNCFEEFKKTIQRGNNYSKYNDINKKILFSFKKYPRVLKFVIRIRGKIINMLK